MSEQHSPAQRAMSPIEIADLQREVQRLLGRCMLRLQQYEHLLKVLVVHCEDSGPAHLIEEIREKRIRDAATKPLGFLIGKLLESYAVASGSELEAGGSAKTTESNSFAFRFRIEMSADDYAHTRDSLKDLLELRNGLVHHFIQRFDVWQPAGCAAARDHLLTCYDRIESHFQQLRSWAENTEEARQLASTLIQSSLFHDLIVNGIAPDGTVN